MSRKITFNRDAFERTTRNGDLMLIRAITKVGEEEATFTRQNGEEGSAISDVMYAICSLESNPTRLFQATVVMNRFVTPRIELVEGLDVLDGKPLDARDLVASVKAAERSRAGASDGTFVSLDDLVANA